MTKAFTIFLVSETPDVGYTELYALKFALEQNAQHCAMAWQKEGVKAPAIEIGTSPASVPSGCFPLIFMDESSQRGVLAQHYYDYLRRGPAGRVFVGASSGFNFGHQSVAESASHEVVEMMCNPRLTEWRNSPLHGHDPNKVKVALEVADPVQDTYIVKHRGTKWKVANFITPAWFYRDFNGQKRVLLSQAIREGMRFDRKGRLKHAGDILPEGYIITSRLIGDYWKRRNEFLHSSAITHSKGKHLDHPLSRTNIYLNNTVIG